MLSRTILHYIFLGLYRVFSLFSIHDKILIQFVIQNNSTLYFFWFIQGLQFIFHSRPNTNPICYPEQFYIIFFYGLYRVYSLFSIHEQILIQFVIQNNFTLYFFQVYTGSLVYLANIVGQKSQTVAPGGRQRSSSRYSRLHCQGARSSDDRTPFPQQLATYSQKLGDRSRTGGQLNHFPRVRAANRK